MVTLYRFIGSKVIDLIPSSFFNLRGMIVKFMKIKTGENVKINIGFRIYGPGPVVIDDNTWIGPNCRIYTADSNGLFIGKNCDIAPEVVFVCGTHDIGTGEHRAGRGRAHNIIIGDGTWIGCRSTILAETIENGCIIGAGSVVLENISANQLAAGVPAAVKREIIK